MRLLPYFALMAGPSLAWAMYRLAAQPATSLSEQPAPTGLGLVLASAAGTLWTVYATAVSLLLWYRLRAERESLTLTTAAREIGIRLPKT